MPEDATVRDLIVAVRADEASHSHVNHTLSSMGTRQSNPFHVGHTELPENFAEPPPVSPRALSMNPRASALSGPRLTRCTV